MMSVFIRLCVVSLLVLYGFNAWAAAKSNSDKRLRVGYHAMSFPDFSLADIQVSIKLFAEELGQSIGIDDVEVLIYEDIDLMRKDFEQGALNYVAASTLLLATKFDTRMFADGFRFIRDSEYADSLVVLAQKHDAKVELKDFKGKRLVLAQTDPLVDLYMDFLSLSVFKKSYSSAFNVPQREKKSHQLILRVFFGQADLACVHNFSYQNALELNPQIQDKLQVIARLDNIPEGAGFFHKNTPAEFREYVIRQAMTITDTVRGKQFLEMFKSDLVIRSTLEDLLPAQQLYVAHQRLLSAKPHLDE